MTNCAAYVCVRPTESSRAENWVMYGPRPPQKSGIFRVTGTITSTAATAQVNLLEAVRRNWVGDIDVSIFIDKYFI